MKKNKNWHKYHLQSRHIYNAWMAIGQPNLRTIVECAVGPYSLLQRFEGKAERTVLIEPSPKMAAVAAQRYPWAEVVEIAVADSFGKANLRSIGGQSYIKGIGWAPVFSGRKSKYATAGKIAVGTVPFSALDDGRIDILNLDCEGSEWFVLKHMTSRPVLIQVELYKRNKYYSEIVNWMETNGYAVVGKWGNANRIYEKR